MKKLPATLSCALVIRVVATAGFAIARLSMSAEGFPLRLFLVSDGVYIATDVLAFVGFLELARRSTGRARTGANVATAASALGLAITAFWLGIEYFQPQWRWLDKVGTYGEFVLGLVLLAGVTIAASARHAKAAIAGVIVILVADPVPPLAQHLWGWIHSFKGAIAVEHLLRLAQAIAVLVLATLAAPEGEAPRAPQAATDGLRLIASALWLRVIAAVGVAGLTLMLMMGRPGEGSLGVLKLAMISGAVINLVSLAMIVRGALGGVRAGIAELPWWSFAASAIATLWCLGVAIHQLPYTYKMLYGDHDSGYFGTDAQDYVQALALTVPLVATGAIAIIATGIAGFASRRGLEQLRADAQGKGFGFVAVMLGSIAIQQWLLPKADSLGNFAFMTLLAAGCALAATVMMARLCTRAADSLHTEPALPPAKVI